MHLIRDVERRIDVRTMFADKRDVQLSDRGDQLKVREGVDRM